ncbi:MAG TPA: class I SAM-dependent rRNA methyltransferase, partial [Planctomycetota bacterium]|nr:class I SAM-dependent rRNA methyltransferase [Planctomycetota bacterium]
WVFGRQVEPAPEVPNGTLVEIIDAAGRFVGHGLYNGASDIRIRVLHRGKKSAMDSPRQFLQRALAEAIRLRKRVLRLPEVTDAWRAVFAEGDDMPGLIVDHFAGHLVCEHHSLGFWNLREDIGWALEQLIPGAPIVHRMPQGAARSEGGQPGLDGAPPSTVWIREHGIEYPVELATGHKTGWFCDQRDNRQRVADLANDRFVLDLCCNRGGFALNAKRAGARRVHAVDLDEVALDGARQAAARNHLDIEFEHADAFQVLRSMQGAKVRPNLIVLDPHKLIRGQGNMDEGRRKYGDFNSLALQTLAPGGLLATFSCSGALDLPSFLGILFQSARRAERGLRLLSVYGAALDHPQRPDFPRGAYLKGALCVVDG